MAEKLDPIIKTTINDLILVNPIGIYYNGKDGQIHCEYTKSGKHYIYAHFQKDTEELFYIGLGKYNRCNQMCQRNNYWKSVKSKHGLIVRLLEVELNLEQAIEREKFYIKKYQPKTNMTIGGEAGNNEKTRIKVYSYHKDGSFYKCFYSITDANMFFNTKENDSRISRCLNGKRNSFAGYMWRTEYFEFIEPYKKSKSWNQKAVHRYDLEGNYTESYCKIKDFKEGSRNGISNCLDKNATFMSSFWRTFKEDKITVPTIRPALKERKMVIDKSTKMIFNSLSDAARHIGLNKETLRRKLSGIRNNNTNMIYYG